MSINPKYASSGNSITGYTYTYQINVDVKNLTSDLLSEVLDTAVSTGGDQLRIQNVVVSMLAAYLHMRLASHMPRLFRHAACKAGLAGVASHSINRSIHGDGVCTSAPRMSGLLGSQS